MHEFPKLYAILDLGPSRDIEAILNFASELTAGGVTLMQFRAKDAEAASVLSHARELRRVLGPAVRLIMNDRADLCIAAGFNGVHVGQDDLSPEGARTVVGPQRWIGVSTHNVDQVSLADTTSADYIAIGPVFATGSKQNPDPVVGLEGVRAARAATHKPLIAIGGITRANCHSVLKAGADSVAVISDLLANPRQRAKEFLNLLAG
ncbi:MAG TPA: thiamine phosphate synthase [Clostridia bacterium]|nr:thiamine phosphate synthase [Clostridia bacterium]